MFEKCLPTLTTLTHRVGAVVDYAGMRWKSHWLREHDVNDYADTDKTTRTLSEKFEGFSQI